MSITNRWDNQNTEENVPSIKLSWANLKLVIGQVLRGCVLSLGKVRKLDGQKIKNVATWCLPACFRFCFLYRSRSHKWGDWHNCWELLSDREYQRPDREPQPSQLTPGGHSAWDYLISKQTDFIHKKSVFYPTSKVYFRVLEYANIYRLLCNTQYIPSLYQCIRCP